MRKNPKHVALPDAVRDFMKRDRRSMYALAEDCGIARGTLSRFTRGERDLTLATADRLCRALGLRLTKGR